MGASLTPVLPICIRIYVLCTDAAPQAVFQIMEVSRAVFCTVCGFWVGVWKSYRTYRSSGYGDWSLTGLTSSGYGYGSPTELTEVPGRYTNVLPVPRVLWHGRAKLAEVRVRVWMSSRTHRSSGYGYACCKELTEVPGVNNTRLKGAKKQQINRWKQNVQYMSYAAIVTLHTLMHYTKT